jgi:hypothetical protein
MAFRVYLAARDVFVRKAARDVFKLRKLFAKSRDPKLVEFRKLLQAMKAEAVSFGGELRAGRKAAQSMWARTRNSRIRGHNETILDADEQRLTEWRDWLIRAKADPQTVRHASPVCGAWQLNFWVHNFAPAVQKVVVEQQQPDGSWSELAARHTIEFRAKAARPAAKIRREFSVPVGSPDSPLHIVVQGVGQVAISHVMLTDGVTSRHTTDWSQKKTIGLRPATEGLPEFNQYTSVRRMEVRVQ